MGKLSIHVKFVQTDGQTMVKQYAHDLSTWGHKKKGGGGEEEERVKLLWFIFTYILQWLLPNWNPLQTVTQMLLKQQELVQERVEQIEGKREKWW